MSARKYFWTPDKDNIIHAQYQVPGKDRTKPVAAILGVPRWVVQRRARDLGLVKPKEKPWSISDVNYLETYRHTMPIKTLARKLGRSVEAVVKKSTQLGYRKNGVGYTEGSLAAALGVSTFWVGNRIKRGLLHARVRGTERTPQQGGDMYLITDRDLIAFLRDHTFEIDLRKVDQVWFLDLLHDALVGGATGRAAKGGHNEQVA